MQALVILRTLVVGRSVEAVERARARPPPHRQGSEQCGDVSGRTMAEVRCAAT